MTDNVTLKFKTIYTTQKVAFRTNMKDPTPRELRSKVVYQFNCPGCNAAYIGKTERNLLERCSEHATAHSSAIRTHLKDCEQFQFISSLMTMDIDTVDFRALFKSTVVNNTRIIDSSDNWNILLTKEALYIKRNKPLLNSGLKASRDLYLF